jgi:NTP pyrophosphatase (non-canonical NTP hydrolase)
MDFTQYQRASAETMIYPHALEHDIAGLMYAALGLAGEAGELANKIKKLYRDGDAFREDWFEVREALIKELGDVLWYTAAMASELDADLEKAAAYNVAKLRDRARRGVLGGSGDDR